ncbi:hypothetical protein SYNPS1DRAFT_30238 [Syncephalis pseudoplumigaleata]|uniref:Methyltransferase type 11 domain-containing protein n=1 Tax=Syncephalis pseudoplumigaleata TaxID=1712513 RepID=A0A4P9YXE0_9FUNG|nr:hypothetical protein SYNPS1DRAFT_30238 [Syncephalis pseudoplumigaleata]|eukprot:RKP23991.1 hypothetical protein SYNPS1DRAFT_30238 [Syncephalis pseudoplumigaleata]
MDDGGDVALGLAFPDHSIDYIHHRNVYTIPMDDWPAYIIDCARVLRASGWLEIMETDYMLRRTGPEGARFNKLLRRTIAREGIKPRALTHIASWMASEAELDNVKTQAYEIALVPPSSGASASIPAVSASTPNLQEEMASSPLVPASGGPRWSSFYGHMMAYYPAVAAACEIELSEWAALLEAVAVEARTFGTFMLYMVVVGQKPGCPPTPM